MFAWLTTLIAETISYPTDTIKRKMMMGSGGENKVYKNSWDCIKTVFRDEGFRGFMKGNVSN